MVVADLPGQREHVGRDAPEEDVGVHDLHALEGRNDQIRCIKDLHSGLKSSTKGAPVATKIVLSPKLPAALVETARSIMPPGYDLQAIDQGTPEFLDAVEDAEYFVGFARTSLGSDFYRAAPRLKLVQLISAGYDRLDVEAARKARVPVANNGGANGIAVAEHTLLLILAVYKKLVWMHN